MDVYILLLFTFIHCYVVKEFNLRYICIAFVMQRH